MNLPKYSFGVGDRFGHQAKAQLSALKMAVDQGVDVVPVWNKSHREHTTIGTQPNEPRLSADAAVAALGWDRPYFIDADHIGLATVDGFMEPCDFFTIDVADSIGKSASDEEVQAFLGRHPELVGDIAISGIDEPITIAKETLEAVARTYLQAVLDAAAVYRHIESAKGKGNFVTEVSMDETDNPQGPLEMLVILAAVADQGIPIQTIAPKFSGRFNKGVDYVGDVAQFAKEFDQDLAVVAHAVKQYGLPEDLKLSVHSGSDKFSIYESIRKALQARGAGVHLKTAGTTWLEELIGLAEAGGDGLALAKEIYAEALAVADKLCAPYASVIDIDESQLPTPEEVEAWTSEQYASALRHDQTCPQFNPHFRQLLHVGYKIAAQMGDRYLNMLDTCEESISRNVIQNLYDRHLVPLLLG